MKTIYLNIHNFLTVQINQPSRHEYIKDINQPFSYFETESVKNPDIVLHIGDFEPQNDNCFVVDHKCHIKNDYIYCSDRIQKIPFKVEIKGLESLPTIINVYVKTKKLRQIILPSALAQNVFLKPIIDFKLLQRRVLSVHGAAVAKSRGAIVFLGRGGTFKTSLQMDLIRKRGYKFLGDDRILISGANTYCYPIHQVLFDFRTAKMKTENYGEFDKFRYLVHQAKKQKSGNYIIESAPLFKTFCIVKHKGAQVKTRKFNKSDLTQKTVKSHTLENMNSLSVMGVSEGKLYEYFTAYAFIFPQSKIASYWADYGTLVDEYFKDGDFTEICLPGKYTLDVYSQVVSLID